MARRVTPADIIEFHRLYTKYGTYAEAARYTDFPLLPCGSISSWGTCRKR